MIGSLIKELAAMPEAEVVKILNGMSDSQANTAYYNWETWARPNQLPPDWDWYIWMMQSGRGSGKTRPGGELVCKWAEEGYSPIALIGKTAADVRDVMVELGESSILKISPPWFMPVYEPSKRRLTWPNGVVATTYAGDEPDQLRGPQHKKAWADELAKWKYAQDAWDNLMLGLRIGDNPQVVISTTPRPIRLIKDLVADERSEKNPEGQVAITRGHTLDNRANLSPAFLRMVLRKYEGTRLGRQELAGEILDDNPDALWQRDLIDDHRLSKYPELKRIVVGLDVQGTDNENSASTGIVVAGIAEIGDTTHGYVLADLTLSGTPEKWATAAVAGYHSWKADRIVAEVNFGGDMVESIIRIVDRNVAIKKVHASRGKAVRAEPVSALYEQGRVHHIGFLPDLEDQLCEWVPGDKSPDRLDALVWAITELLVEEQPIEWRML